MVTFTTAQNAPFHPVITNNSCGFGLPGDGTISLSVTPTLTWTPSGPGDTSLPPSTIQVLETANANSSHYMVNPVGVVTQAADGFNDPMTYQTAPVYGALSSGKHLLSLTIPAGQLSITLPTRSLSVSLSQTSYLFGGSPGMSVNYSVQLDNRKAWISSQEIDDSYRKGPYDSVHGTDRYLNQPNSDGSISTDTAAAYDLGFYGGFPFYGGNHYTASTSNFSNTAYNWTITATDLSGRDFSVAGGNKQTIQAIISLGKKLDGFPKHSTFKVDVQDSLDSAIASNTYGVNWHLPVENWTLLTSIPTTNRMYPKPGADIDGNTSIEPSRTTYYTIPTEEIDVAGPAVKTLSVFLSGTAAAAPLLLPEGIATGPIGVATVTLLTVGGGVAAFLVPPDPGHDLGYTNYKDYVAAVTLQQTINTGGIGIQRFNPDLVNQAAANFALLQSKYPLPANWQDHWNEDPYFNQSGNHSLRVAAQVGRYRDINTFQGDAYGPNGYIGITIDPLIRDKNVFYVETWSYR